MNITTEKVNRSKKERLNIVFFIDWIEREFQTVTIQGVIDSARRHNVNLFCIEGGCCNNERKERFDRKQIYYLAQGQKVDGLIVLATTVGNNVPTEQLMRFFRSFSSIPTISIGVEVEGCGSIVVDNITGLREAMIHLITVHQYQRFAFITGLKDNKDANCRFRIFKEVLAEYNLSCDADLIVEGDFCPGSGSEAVRTLLDERQATFDVIVAANDEMALGALEELKARRIDVPDQIAIIGFDDMKVSAYSDPPLTTINSSVYDQGFQAMELLLKTITQDSLLQKISIPSRLILRESCGCLSQITRQSVSGVVDITNAQTDHAIIKNQEQLIANIVEKAQPLFINCPEFEIHQVVANLVDAFQRQLHGETREPFLKAFGQIMGKEKYYRQELFFWQNFLSILRREMLPYIDSQNHLRCEDLFHQMRLLISEKAINQEKVNNYDALNRHSIINNLTELLMGAFSVSHVMGILNRFLPELSSATGYIAEYNMRRQKYQFMMAYNRQGTIPIDPKGVYSDSWIPEEIINDGEPHILLLGMIQYSKTKFSFVALEFERRIIDTFVSLRGVITSALAGVTLVDKVHRQEKNLISQQEHLKNLVEMRRAMEGFVQTILSMIEVRDPYTAGHQSRVATLACAIAEEMHLSREVIEGLHMAGIIHDLGKIVVPFEILNKPGRLKSIEFALIKEHPVVAFEILKNIDFPWPIAQIVAQHHERLDGSGYPAGLHNGEILLEAKIIAVADVIEAMATHRPYRSALGIDKALEEVTVNQGKLYDPKVVETCLELFKVKGYHFN